MRPVTLLLLLAAGCDYDLDFLFAEPTPGLPGVVHLGELSPADLSETDYEDVIVYGNLGATGTVEPGGATFTFRGNGGSVCVFVDPEAATWNQAVAERPGSAEAAKFSYPDNLYDDGDLELSAGFAVTYTGTPANQDQGGRIGDFRTRFQDDLGQTVLISFNECLITTDRGLDGGHSGRGAPEYCTLAATSPGVNYVVVMETWSTPLEDDQLSYGLLFTQGSCDALIGRQEAECVILGESLVPGDEGTNREENGTWVGRGNAPSWPGSSTFEVAFCETAVRGEPAKLTQFCIDEAASKDCATEHCFCGDPTNAPDGGGQ